MSELKVITQAQLLTTTRDLRDRVEISLHKLGPGAKSIQTNLNNIVATLSVQNAHPVDDKQPDLFGVERVGLPKARVPRLTNKGTTLPRISRSTNSGTGLKVSRSDDVMRERGLRKLLTGTPVRQSMWSKLKSGATLAEVEDTWIDSLEGVDSPFKANGCATFCFKTYERAIWWDKETPSGTADIRGKLLLQTIAKVLNIPLMTPAQKRAKAPELTAKERKSIDKVTSMVNCSKCDIACQKSEMKRTAGHRWICKDCAKKSDKKAVKNTPKKVAKRTKPQAAFMAPYTTNVPELQAIIGSKPMPRTDVTKKLWDYIKKNGLQDKANRRNINCDDKLRVIFAKKNGSAPKQVSIFEMTKLLTAKLIPFKEPKSTEKKTPKRVSTPRKAKTATSAPAAETE